MSDDLDHLTAAAHGVGSGNCGSGSRILHQALLVAMIPTLMFLAGCSENGSVTEPVEQAVERASVQYDVDIRWTSYGIPHVLAEDRGSLGYGFAYATASNAFCTIARDIVMVNGDLARHFGPEGGNLESDIFHRAILDNEMIARYRADQSQDTHDFQAGYVAGYNRYLNDHRDSLPEACAGESWVRSINRTDMDRLSIGVGIRYGVGNFVQEMANAAPPGEEVAWLDSNFDGPVGYGSNAVAMGSELTANGKGLLLGNPHYPWRGSSRFHMIHTRIPGELDVMGVSLYTTDRVSIGFNEHIAWTHTVSTGLRVSLYALTLDPDNPMRYRYGDSYRDIVPVEVEVPVLDDEGQLALQNHTVYMTHYGPLTVSNQLPWTSERAFAVRDSNIGNTRAAETYDAIHQADSVEALDAALNRQGIAWVNTVAADRHGSAYYADVSAVPNIDADLLARCDVAPEGFPANVVMLNGADPGCEWHEDARSRVPGLIPGPDMPRLQRQDYVHNANDSYWLSNPSAPLEGYAPVIGRERSQLSLRTRAGLSFIAEGMERGQAMEPEDLQAMLFSHRNFGAELLLDDVLAVCEQHDGDELQEACEVLAAWDRRATTESRGAHVWREFWRVAQQVDNLWRVPFDANDPVHTPRGLNSGDDEVRAALVQALLDGQQQLRNAGVALDARLGDIQFEIRNGEHIPIPGGEGWAGMWSMIVSQLQPEVGYTPIVHGNSYIQVVNWDEGDRVRARAILTYSQSDNPASPYYADQTRLYSRGEWIDLPFYEEDIVADPGYVLINLQE